MGKNRKNDSDSRFDVAKDECKKDSIVVTLTADAFGVDVEKKNSYGCGKRVMPNQKRISVREEPSRSCHGFMRSNTNDLKNRLINRRTRIL
ncbi:unnamed protein product [Brassica oleracea var. botrytis]|uniref:Uncharacterized protein n=1 Tax=Brassica oleracea TaxID=3712 RepID=A0A3P6B7P3_BRAOL|nr:unnamed protein product [Brassica oleracea]